MWQVLEWSGGVYKVLWEILCCRISKDFQKVRYCYAVTGYLSFQLLWSLKYN